MIAINLTQSGTKQIVGEFFARIEITHKYDAGDYFSSAIGYENLPENRQFYFIRNLEVACNGRAIPYYVNAIYNCVNVENVTAVSWSARAGSFGISFCKGVYHCNANAGYGICFCNDVVECQSEGINGATSSHAIDRCYGVRYCSLKSGNAYSRSYSSPTADSTYACANTLNGGWNQ